MVSDNWNRNGMYLGSRRLVFPATTDVEDKYVCTREDGEISKLGG